MGHSIYHSWHLSFKHPYSNLLLFKELVLPDDSETRANFEYTFWIPMSPLANNLGQIPGMPYSSSVRDIPDPGVEIPTTPAPQQNQLMISNALQRLHDERINHLQHFP